MAAFSALSLTPVFWNGALQPGAQIYIFDAGTTTPRTVFKDAGLANAHPSPILADGSGRIPVIFTAGSPYKARLTTAAGSLIQEVDGIPGDSATQTVATGGSGGSDLVTGDVIWSYGTGPRPNFVRPNGRTIGSALSGATERAGAETQNLFVALWTVDTTLVVIGGRGTSALADFQANKQLALPDFRGRGLMGLDDMGSTPAGRLAGATFQAGVATQLGATLGTAAETLAIAQIPPHAHAGSTDIAPGHSHTGTTAPAGGHTPSASIAPAGNHTHAVSSSADVQGAHGHNYSGTTSGVSNDHTHGFSGTTAGAGGHNHQVQGGSKTAVISASNATLGTVGGTDQVLTSFVGDHGHGYSGTTSGVSSNHTHNFSGTTDTQGAHAHNISSSAAAVADHSHAIACAAVPDHQHSFVSDSGGSHQHAVTTNATGGGSPHNNVGPSVLGTFYMRL